MMDNQQEDFVARAHRRAQERKQARAAQAADAWPANPYVPCPVMERNGWRRIELDDGRIMYGPPRRQGGNQA